MGAWGTGTFENDDASDWVAEFIENGDASALESALDTVNQLEDEYIEAPECSVALAAAEVVSALHGRRPEDLPDELAERLGNQPPPPRDLRSKAISAVTRIKLGPNSELRDLWQDSDSFDEWLAACDDLLARLNA